MLGLVLSIFMEKRFDLIFLLPVKKKKKKKKEEEEERMEFLTAQPFCFVLHQRRAGEKEEKSQLMRYWIPLPHIPALFMTSLTQTAWAENGSTDVCFHDV